MLDELYKAISYTHPTFLCRVFHRHGRENNDCIFIVCVNLCLQYNNFKP